MERVDSKVVQKFLVQSENLFKAYFCYLINCTRSENNFNSNLSLLGNKSGLNCKLRSKLHPLPRLAQKKTLSGRKLLWLNKLADSQTQKKEEWKQEKKNLSHCGQLLAAPPVGCLQKIKQNSSSFTLASWQVLLSNLLTVSFSANDTFRFLFDFEIIL